MVKGSGKIDNELILKRRKKIRIKKACIGMVFLISLFFILCFKLPYFNIHHIKVYGNKSISSSEIIDDSKICEGNNIFYIDLGEADNNILSNPYIGDVTISRTLPDIININIKERSSIFYCESGKTYFVIDKSGILLEERNDINNMHLVKLEGMDYNKKDIGKTVENKDQRKIKAITALGSMVENNNLPFTVTNLNVSDPIDIKVYFNNMCVKLGSVDDINKKINRAVNILLNANLSSAKGYIDVRFDSNPVFFIEN
ncbi:cell division protein FtsQ/DivIB [Clostridium sp. WILCCON 0269]|uniref:Cell division protein FtsQ/DivIB n=1 Tax=Candidatus Clostridium eludens TaxID=3381663 RepID=A0ABW8SIE4_9CLOT